MDEAAPLVVSDEADGCHCEVAESMVEMSDQRDGGIAWAEETWNPLRGCREVSPGCASCYAKEMAARFCGPGMPYEGLARRTEAGKAMWTGVFREIPEHMLDPLRWQRSRRIFVNSMSDLFGEGVETETIDRIFGVMLCCSVVPPSTKRGGFRPGAHVFQTLTKRADRQRAYFASRTPGEHVMAWAEAARRAGVTMDDEDDCVEDSFRHEPEQYFPLPNVWLGVSVESPEYVGRVLDLAATPAAVRWVSYEPALAGVDFGLLGIAPEWVRATPTPMHELIDWIVIGGESGPKARPFDIGWARGLIEEARGLNTRVFCKQLGAKPYLQLKDMPGRISQDAPLTWTWPVELVMGEMPRSPVKIWHPKLKHSKGGDPMEWPEELRIREYPEERL